MSGQQGPGIPPGTDIRPHMRMAAALRRALGKRLQKRPLVEVHVLRVP